MSAEIKTKSENAAIHQVTPLDEKRKMASLALKRVDQLIKMKEYGQALLETSHVKEIDRTNVYAFAFEERIKLLQAEDAQLQQQQTQVAADHISAIKTKPSQSRVVTSQTDGMHIPLQALPSKNNSDKIDSTKTDTQVIPNPIEIRSTTSNSLAHNADKIKSQEPARWIPKVVLIDDDTNLREVLKMTIESGGFEVISLSTSDEAYMLLRKFTPDAILCDINLETSTMGGFSFFEKIHQMEDIKHVPFIFLSGMTDDILIRTGKEMGVDDYLTKPIKEQNLLAAIRGRIKRFEELGIHHHHPVHGPFFQASLHGLTSGNEYPLR
jgi:CheY-like chemotaxis protein